MTDGASIDLDAFLRNETVQVERALERALAALAGDIPAELTQPIRQSVMTGGKRLRPILCVVAYRACGGANGPEAYDLSAALELVHAYSLVHDDLPSMDNDDLRRGRPTTHRKFDEATAILAGDALQALAFDILANDQELCKFPEGQVQITSKLAKAIGPSGMAGGQALDISAEGAVIDEPTLEDIHRRKTGELIRASIMMPCSLAQPSPAIMERLDAFGRDIGLVFQIKDDLLEIKQDTATLGKSADSDEDNYKSTYPSLLGARGAEERAHGLYNRAIENLAGLGPRSAGLRWVSDYIISRSN